ncbi:MAG: MFS transporter [Nitrospinaceae bacterium]|nr:MAG: MFS transporter [Nitrospinaceae bacterium]
MKKIPRTVFLLGLVSLFTDFSSEMIYPLLPLFLVSVLGTGALAIGVIEGVAEATASFLKVYSGIWTDRAKRRKPFIVAGYGLAGLARPLIGLAGSWVTVLALRFADRVGKGIRTSPRDAMIADVTPPQQRGAAYGLHRAMDHAGAVIGPLVGAGLLMFWDMPLRQIFLLAAVPALVALFIAWAGVREPPLVETAEAAPTNWMRGWQQLGRDYMIFLVAVLLFTLGNSTDAFLILRLTDQGVPAGWMAVLWSLHHVVKMLASYLGGRFSDSLGHRRQLISGWGLYALIYLAFSLVESTLTLVVMFLVYGIYYGFVEPAERALVAELAPEHLRGTAFGYFHLVTGLGALPASLLFGLIWQVFGAPAAFLAGAGLALLASLLLFNNHRGH